MEREKQKFEAIERMKLLFMSKDVINDFKKNGVVYYSERQNAFFDGILYWIRNEDEYVKIVKEFEAEHNALVYHAQLTHSEFGDMLSLLFVGDDESEWKQERDELINGDALAYVVNLDEPSFSEFGGIGIKPKNGGISRTY